MNIKKIILAPALSATVLAISFACVSTQLGAVETSRDAQIPLSFSGPLDAGAMQNLKPAEVIPVTAGGKRMDAWWETYLNFGTASRGGDIRATPHWRLGWRNLREEMPFENDPSKNRVGDFSVVFDAARADAGTYAVGLHSGPFLQPWKLDDKWTLQLWIKGEGMDRAPELVLIDQQAKRAVGKLSGFSANGQWHEQNIALSELKAEAGFDFSAVRAVQFEQNWAKTARLSIDGVRFFKGDMEMGLSDKNLDQRIDEASRTRLLRMHESITNSTTLLGESSHRTNYYSDLSLWPRKDFDLAAANKTLGEQLAANLEKAKANKHPHWAGIANPVELNLYWAFGSRSQIFPGRLSQENETLLLELLWETSKHDNDIFCANLPSLWVFSSENHDTCWRSKAIVSAGIFKDIPGFKDRLYPDTGFGPGFPGYGYPPVDLGEKRPYYPYGGEFGPLSDGKRYAAPAHYEAWKDLWHRYFDDRAAINFFIEQGGGYREILLRHMYTVYLYGGDEGLRNKARMFLDLFWLKYSQNSLAGYEGGPKARQAPDDYYDSRHNPFVTFQLGGPATGQSIWYWRNQMAEALMSDYDLPRIAWAMMLDKKGLGDFVFEARGVAEENDIDVRPEGSQNMFMLDGEQRQVRYRYNTPYYLLSTHLDSPKMIYNHLARSQIFQGLFAPWSDAVITPIAPDDGKTVRKAAVSRPIHGVQDKNVFVGYYDPLTRVRSPQWFPAWDRKAFVDDAPEALDKVYWAFRGYKLRVFQSTAEIMVQGWDEVIEDSGWVFSKAGCVYAASRIVVPLYDGKGNPVMDENTPGLIKLRTEDCYYWNEDHSIYGTKSSDVMIIEAGSEEEYGSFENFRKAILNNKLDVWMVRLAPILVYQGSHKDAKEIVLNLEHPHVAPKLDGVPINYELPWTVKSPFMKSEYKSGIFSAQFGDEALELDFKGLKR